MNPIDDFWSATIIDAQAPLYDYVCRMVRDQDVAADIVQETVLIALQQRAANPPECPRAWLFSVATRRVYRHFREARKHREGVPNVYKQPQPVSSLEQLNRAEQERLVQSHLDRLEPEDRALLILAYHEGLSQQQAAVALDMPRTTIASRLKRALDRLHAALGASGFAFVPGMIESCLRSTPQIPAPSALLDAIVSSVAKGSQATASATLALGGTVVSKSVVLALTIAVALSALAGGILAGRWSLAGRLEAAGRELATLRESQTESKMAKQAATAQQALPQALNSTRNSTSNEDSGAKPSASELAALSKPADSAAEFDHLRQRLHSLRDRKTRLALAEMAELLDVLKKLRKLGTEPAREEIIAALLDKNLLVDPTRRGFIFAIAARGIQDQRITGEALRSLQEQFTVDSNPQTLQGYVEVLAATEDPEAGRILLAAILRPPYRWFMGVELLAVHPTMIPLDDARRFLDTCLVNLASSEQQSSSRPARLDPRIEHILHVFAAIEDADIKTKLTQLVQSSHSPETIANSIQRARMGALPAARVRETLNNYWRESSDEGRNRYLDVMTYLCKKPGHDADAEFESVTLDLLKRSATAEQAINFVAFNCDRVKWSIDVVSMLKAIAEDPNDSNRDRALAALAEFEFSNSSDPNRSPRVNNGFSDTGD